MTQQINLSARRTIRKFDDLEIRLALSEAVTENPHITQGELMRLLVELAEEYGLKSIPVSLVKFVINFTQEVNII